MLIITIALRLDELKKAVSPYWKKLEREGIYLIKGQWRFKTGVVRIYCKISEIKTVGENR